MADTSELLAEAKSALHSLLTGQAVVEVRDQNGETVRYTPSNRSALQQYIQTLQFELSRNMPSPPLGVRFM